LLNWRGAVQIREFLHDSSASAHDGVQLRVGCPPGGQIDVDHKLETPSELKNECVCSGVLELVAKIAQTEHILAATGEPVGSYHEALGIEKKSQW
jgi:hypothetical protein